jgi:DNA-binding NarL/FixJ family response regulator
MADDQTYNPPMGTPAAEPLIERDAELAALEAAATDAVAGEGRLVVVEGPAGIGKTRLLRSVRELELDSAELRVLAARATELETHIAFGVVRQLLDPVVLAIPEGEREALFTGAARLARTVISSGEIATGGDASDGADRYSKINGLFWLVSTLARDQPLALVVDDAQWADEPSLEFLGFLARRAEGLPLLVVTATRPAREAQSPLSAALVTEPTATVLRPAPLSRASVETLVHQTAGADADEDFAAACLEVTRGNPFLLSELLREVEARRIAPTAEAARRVGSLTPGGVSAAIELRLAQMPPQARPLAEAIAVFGDGTNATSAARLAGLDPASVAEAETALVRAGILEDRHGLCFTHPLVRATVLHAISPTERARLHATAAELLRERGAAPEELASHLLHVHPAASQETVAQLRAAAARATQLGSPATAAAYLKRAAAEPPAREARCEVLTELGQAEARSGLGDATAHLRQAVEQAADAPARAQAALELARALKFGGDAVHAIDVLDELAPDVEALDSELRDLIELERLGLGYLSEGARARLAGRIAALRDPGGEPRTSLEAFILAGLAFDTAAAGLGSAAEAAELAARAVASDDLIPVDPTEGHGMLIAAVATMWSDRLDDASRMTARMLEEGRRRGSVVARSAAASMQALVNWRRGRIPDAEADCSLALDLAVEAEGTDALLNASRAVKALVALARGAGAEELLRIETEVLGANSDPDGLPHHLVLHARGVTRIARGEIDDGIADLLECGRVSLAWGSSNPTTVPWRSDAAIALARAGDRDRAAQLGAEELELAKRFGAKRAIGIAQRAVALVADDATTLPTLELAVSTLSESPAALDLAVAMSDLAGAQRRAGKKATARENATRAQELATACGATALAGRAQEEALAAGARPRRVALRGVDSLTPSELRVAQRAAEGNTNREIAEDLFVTVKTIEMHLANAYGKLDIRSRTQLATALEEGGASPEPVSAVG